MSGIEALGFACCIFQVITFARDTAQLCQDIYNGQKHPDSHLEDVAKAMREAADQVKTSCSAANGPLEGRLAEIAKNCIPVAEQLEAQVQAIQKHVNKGSSLGLVRARFRSYKKRKTIDDLERQLGGYTDAMEHLMTTELFFRNKAGELKQQQGFQKLDADLQSFISKLTAGITDMKDLLRQENQSTQDHITREARQAKTSIMEQAKMLRMEQAKEQERRQQRTRLIESLRFDEMNHRQNHIMDPEDAAFDRIFRSYDDAWDSSSQGSFESQDSWESQTSSTIQHEIDKAWQSFVTWLQSDDDLFWIQGKPGSGKSTLVKNILHRPKTEEHLNQWRPGTQILSHFFWRFGSPLQFNRRGLYSSLIHQLFQRSDLVDHVIRQFAFTTSKNCVNDWSLPELKIILNASIEFEQGKRAYCIFIDGLDEYNDDDGPEGIVAKVQMLASLSNVKLCVASRPEPQLQKRLSHVPNLRLHDLTWPDMRAYALSEFENLEALGELTSGRLKRLIDELLDKLLDKAQGVFLWLRLAVKSLKDGIEWGDSNELLDRRLEQLPNELDALYAAMWTKVNRDENIYRESAALYFWLVIQAATYWGREISSHRSPPLLLLAFAVELDIQERLLFDMTHDIHIESLETLCNKTTKEILTRCAGLLEIRPPESTRHIPGCSPDAVIQQEVMFIHRTAQDFLMDTSAGRRILHHVRLSKLDIMSYLVRGKLCYDRTAKTLCRQHGQYVLPKPDVPLWKFFRVLDMVPMLDECGETVSKRKAFDLLPVFETLFHNGFFDGRFFDILIRPKSQYGKKPQFLSIVAQHRVFDDFVLSLLDNEDASMATDILRHICWLDLSWGPDGISMELIQKILLRGGDPVAIAVQGHTPPKDRSLLACEKSRTAIRATPLWEILATFLNRKFFQSAYTDGWYDRTMDIIITMLEMCDSRTADGWGLVIPAEFKPNGDWTGSDLTQLATEHIIFSESLVPVFELNVSSLLSIVLDHLPRTGESNLAKVRAIRDRVINPVAPSLLFIRYRYRMKADPRDWGFENHDCWYRVVDQLPLQDIIDVVFHSSDGIDKATYQPRLQRWYEIVMSLKENPDVLQEVDYDEVLNAPGDRLGICSLKDAGFV